MRKLMWASIGFAGACAVGAYFAWGMWLIMLALFCLAGLLGILLLKSKARKPAAFLFLGFLVGILWMWGFDGLYLSTAREYHGETIQAAVEVTDYSRISQGRTVADGKIHLEGKPYRVRLYLYRDAPLSPGDVVEGEFSLRYTGVGGEKEPTYHQGKGIFLLCYGDGTAEIVPAQEIPTRYVPAKMRKSITQMLDTLFPADTVGFARALLLGDDSLLSYETDTDLQVSGIRHVIAVSGLHVSILFSTLYLLCGKRRYLTALLGIPVLVCFAAVAGFTPSIVRACIMQCLMILALLINKEYDPPTALAFAVLVLLTINPLTITSVSFQLSVGSIVGIFLLSGSAKGHLLGNKRKRRTVRTRIRQFVAGSLSVTLGAMAITTPLCAYYFGSVSLVGVLTNLLTLWAVSLTFCGIGLSCLVGYLWLPLGRAIAWLVSFLIRYVLRVSDFLSDFSLAAVYTASVYIVCWILFCYVLLMVFLSHKKKHPVLFGSCIGAGLIVAVALSWCEPKLDNYRVTVLDVGQGQSVLLQCKEETYLVDCGSEAGMQAADIAMQTMLSQGITYLDGIILTHFDSDHANGVEGLMTRIPVERLYLPDIYDDNGLRQQIEAIDPGRTEFVTEINEITMEGGKLTLFPSEQGSSDNESGLCILFQPGEYDILITGDRGFSGERELMAQTDLPELELLVVGHHGSKHSTGLEFLRETMPAFAVISAGEHNSYGHPAQDTLDRLELFGCKILRTDLDGTITFRG